MWPKVRRHDTLVVLFHSADCTTGVSCLPRARCIRFSRLTDRLKVGAMRLRPLIGWEKHQLLFQSPNNQSLLYNPRCSFNFPDKVRNCSCFNACQKRELCVECSPSLIKPEYAKWSEILSSSKRTVHRASLIQISAENVGRRTNRPRCKHSQNG